jgi:hypothetical protein
MCFLFSILWKGDSDSQSQNRDEIADAQRVFGTGSG